MFCCRDAGGASGRAYSVEELVDPGSIPRTACMAFARQTEKPTYREYGLGYCVPLKAKERLKAYEDYS